MKSLMAYLGERTGSGFICRNRVREALRRRPFLIVSAPLGAGILLADSLPGSALLWPALGALPILFLFRRRVAAWALIGLAAGVARGDTSEWRPDDDVRNVDRD